ncbi:RNA polymerase II transcription factor B subunit 4 [Malassezia sp. CBS 17886]|nr:RNA polymerase II transcription factor B subunit 4 [Malassezia sp. CBS 17886]
MSAGAMAHDSAPDAGESAGALAPDFLVVVLDLNADEWFRASRRAGDAFAALRQALASVLVFLNAHMAMQHGNGLAVYGVASGVSRRHPAKSPGRHATESKRHRTCRMGMSLPFQQIDDVVFDGARRMLEDASACDSARGPVNIVKALSLALCFIHRQTLSGTADTSAPHDGGTRASATRHRILLLSASPDASSQYVPMMNCIFSAQKQVRLLHPPPIADTSSHQGIPIDVCKLFGEDTVFLRQACHVTGGNYYRLRALDELLQVLMCVYLPSRSIRGQLQFPALDEVDFHEDVVRALVRGEAG